VLVISCAPPPLLREAREAWIPARDRPIPRRRRSAFSACHDL
jgi:hypothetical protein